MTEGKQPETTNVVPLTTCLPYTLMTHPLVKEVASHGRFSFQLSLLVKTAIDSLKRRVDQVSLFCEYKSARAYDHSRFEVFY